MPAGIASTAARNRVSASNARSLRSSSTKSRSIASAPTSPTERRYGSSRVGRCGVDERDARDRVQLARALVEQRARRARTARGARRSATSSCARPSRSRRCGRGRACTRWRTRSASPNRNERSTTASVLYVRPTRTSLGSRVQRVRAGEPVSGRSRAVARPGSADSTTCRGRRRASSRSRPAARARLAVAAVDAELVLHRTRRAVGRRSRSVDPAARSRRSAARIARGAGRPRCRQLVAGRSGMSRARQSASSA